jgi:uncharacterized membrane protein
MRTKLKRKVKRAWSPTVILAAMAIPMGITVVGMSVDMGLMSYKSYRLQAITDAAVSAGASSLPGDPDHAVSTAVQYAQQNGVDASEIVVTRVSKDDGKLTMAAEQIVPCYFGRMFGLSEQRLHVESTSGPQPAEKSSSVAQSRTSDVETVGLPN